MESFVGVVLNPKAGGGKGLDLLPQLVSTLRATNRKHHIHVTERAGDGVAVATDFANQGAEVVIALGGDGTINEVVNGLVAADRKVPMGIIPCGHGSDFCRGLNLPNGVVNLVTHNLRGSSRPVDVGRITFADGSSRCFINVAGLGFDTVVAERTTRTRLPGATLPYITAVVGALPAFKNFQVTITTDDDSFTGPAFSVLVANSNFFAGGMHIAPMAKINDGLLDIAILGDLGKFEVIRAVPGVYRGKHVNHKKFHHLAAKSVTISTDRPTRVQLDGEIGGYSPITISVEPGALLLV